MKIAIRVLCILTLIYNLYFAIGGILLGIARGVGIGGHWLEAYPNVRMLVMLLDSAALMFLLFHSIRLIMFFDFSRKVQFWLSALYPLYRIPYGILFMLTFPTHAAYIIFMLLILLAVDIGIALAMRSVSLRTLFKEAEDKRSMKYWAKKNDFRGI
jgi:hypothetical protein